MADVEQAEAHAHAEALTLARTLIGEAGWLASDDELAAIAWALRYRWQERKALDPDLSFEAHMRDYSATWKGDSPRKRWVRQLPADGTKPTHWPAKARWRSHVRLWRHALGFAVRFEQGAVADPSGGRVRHWGGRGLQADRRRARRAVGEGRWVPVEIAGARNAFYGRRR